jgi:hypothetical protein
MNSPRRRAVADEETVAPVRILDGQGRVIQTVPADEFRRIHGVAGPPTDTWRQRRGHGKPSATGQGAIDTVGRG